MAPPSNTPTSSLQNTKTALILKHKHRWHNADKYKSNPNKQRNVPSPSQNRPATIKTFKPKLQLGTATGPTNHKTHTKNLKKTLTNNYLNTTTILPHHHKRNLKPSTLPHYFARRMTHKHITQFKTQNHNIAQRTIKNKHRWNHLPPPPIKIPND